jgi:hypothetical protein
MSIFLLCLLILFVLLLPAGLVLISPPSWIRAVAGWGLLAAGWVYILDHIHHPAPYDDDFMDLDTGIFLGMIWAATIAAALVARQRALLDPDPAPPGPAVLQWLRCWSIPIAFLMATAFLHWLSNRLAGAGPAWQVHFWALALPLSLMLLLSWARRWRMEGLSGRQRFGLAFPAFLALLVAWNAYQGFTAWSGARAFAAGRPHCLMTYGGFEHRRVARSGWELSPLVDRARGNWAVSKTPTLSVATAEAFATYRLLGRGWQSTNERPQCWPG